MKPSRRALRKKIIKKQLLPDILNPYFEPRGDEDDDSDYWVGKTTYSGPIIIDGYEPEEPE